MTLLLSDARFPGGGHAHSGGVEQACDNGVVADVAGMGHYLRGRLVTAGKLAAHTSAAVCAQARPSPDLGRFWRIIASESDVRIQSPTSRAVSRQQGGQLLRAARRIDESPLLVSLAKSSTDAGCHPHHAVVIGAVASAHELLPLEAAEIAAYTAVSGPASAALRLLGLDPALVARGLAELAGDIDSIAADAAASAFDPVRRLPSPSAPILDLLAEQHRERRGRLFAS